VPNDNDWDEVLIQKVPRLAELLRETGAEEIEIGDRDRMIRVRQSIGVSSTEPVSESEAEEPMLDDGVTHIESEQVGVFMAVAGASSSNPTAVGDVVEEGQVIGSVDVLGVAHEVCSPISGVIDEVLVHDGAVVEFGQELAKVRLVKTYD
jgi:biotin carboxyl carrier protein